MTSKPIVLILLLSIGMFSCTNDQMPTLVELDMELRSLVEQASPEKSWEYYVLPDENDLASIPQDPHNPLTKAKVELGKMLYFDTGLAMDAKKESGKGTYSCATCHVPEAGFKPNNFQGIADGGVAYGVAGEKRAMNTEYKESEIDVQSARPLTMVNVAFVKNTMWNGSFGAGHVNEGTEERWNDESGTARNHMGMSGMETQNIDGLIVHRIRIEKTLLDQLGYTKMFDEAFPEIPESERYTLLTGSFALSAYIRSILSTRAPFQRWLKGDLSALSYQEKKGAILFFGKANCANCHFEPNLGSHEFHALGVKDMYQTLSYNAKPTDKRNLGRGGFTKRDEDMFKFKVPGLYNVGDTHFYFHGASKRSLEDVIKYKALAQSENPEVPQERISTKLVPVTLTSEEVSYLVSFLDKSLRDPDLLRYKPTHVLSGNCFPNNDRQSRIDAGCN
ncbi:MAG: cytochrome-c peroxidase [Saprospiraceae bacterium]|nr:cytochrome-c peroxidase [Saprospiraceae bacterium]